jgi:hypothetical protein
MFDGEFPPDLAVLRARLIETDKELDQCYVGIQLPEHPWFAKLKSVLLERSAIRMALKDRGAI